MDLRMRSIKTFFGLICFSAVIVLSFFVISDIEKTLIFGPAPMLVHENDPQPQPVQDFPPAPRPPAVIVPVPRIVIHDAAEHIAYRGYSHTAFVEFGERLLSFHLAGGVDMGYAQLTIISIMEVFDAAYETFAGGIFYDFYIVADYGNIPRRRINYNTVGDFCPGTITYLFFLQSGQYPLPKWLCIGIENYLMTGDASPLSNEDLAAWLSQCAEAPAFGDAWLINSLGPRGITRDDIANAAYTFVIRWSLAGGLNDIVDLAQSDTRAFASVFNAYIVEFTGSEEFSALHILYRFGDFKAVTAHGGYIFVDDNYAWAWPRVLIFIAYMDAAIEYVSYRFVIDYVSIISVTLYPYGVINIPDAIMEMADMFGWEAPEVNFVSSDAITLAGTSRFGTWAMSHEVAHILLFREFPDYHPATWMVEGMAVLGELLFRENFNGVRPYRFNVPTLANIDTMSRGGNGHNLPFFEDEYSFGRNSWTYEDAGSFVLYLYNNFGIEALFEMYRTDNYSQFDMAAEIFGKELEELLYSWRGFLWPGGEPTGWWTR